MKPEPVDLLAFGVGAILFGSVLYESFKSSRQPIQEAVPEKPLKGSILNRAGKVSREPSKTRFSAKEIENSEMKALLLMRSIEESKSPKLSTKNLEISSRRPTTISGEKFTTSKSVSTETTPLNLLSNEEKDSIRRYPPEYYTLSKKAQWKYRKRLIN